MSQLFTSDGQIIGASASSSVLPMNIQCWFPWGLACLISLLSKGLWRVFCSTTFQKHQFLGAQPFLRSNSHICTWLLEKTNKQSNTALTMLLANNIVVWLCCWPLLAKWCLCFIKWCLGLLIFFQEASFNFMAVVTICSDFGNQENKVCYCFHFFPIYLS